MPDSMMFAAVMVAAAWLLVPLALFVVIGLIRRRAYHRFRCGRGEHEWRVERERAFRYPSSEPNWPCRGVADRTTETRTICRHCGTASEWLIVNRDPLQSLSMSTESWDQLREEGRLSR